MSAPVPEPAETALRFMAMFGQAHSSMRHVFERYVKGLSPEVGVFLSKRLGRMSDDERVTALRSLAIDHGEACRVEIVARVGRELKTMRDALAHPDLVAVEGGAVLTHGSGGNGEFTTADLLRAYGRAQWIVDSVHFIGHAAGVMAYDGKPHVRRSGVSLDEAPPPLEPPDGPLDDPMVLWLILEDEEAGSVD